MIKWFVFLFLFCAACGNPQMNSQNTANSPLASSFSQAADSSEVASCGRLNYPKFVDIHSQTAIENEIELGSARIIIHFHQLGEAAINQYLEQTEGVVEVNSEWPDWGALAITVDQTGLRQTMRDCSIRIIEADQKQFPQ